jgi:hypothetical protein
LVQGFGSFPIQISKFLGVGGTLCTHDATGRLAMHTGVFVYERALQTAYTVRRLNFLMVILVTLCRGK